jgi:hypothetical protein
MDEQAKEWRGGGEAISCACKCKWETNALSKIIWTLLYYAFIMERLSLFILASVVCWIKPGLATKKASPRKQNPY